MRRYLLDSNAVNAFVNRHAPFSQQARKALALGDVVGTCEPVVAEVLYGIELSATRDENLKLLHDGLREIRTWPFDRAAAKEYGRIAADLKRRGRPMQIIYMMLAAVALRLPKCTVVTTDSDLSAIPGLTVVDWTIAP